MLTFQEFIEESESIADYFLKRGGKRPMTKAESDAALKARAEKHARENPPKKPEPTKEKYPLGGRDERSGRSYSEEAEGVAEGGPFSYGAKQPRKGTVAHNAMMKRREQEKNYKPIEPKDQMVGTAKVTKSVAEAILSPTEFLKGRGPIEQKSDQELQQHLKKKVAGPGALVWRKKIKDEIARRKQQGVAEEVDNIEELNKSTLGSYVKKAAKEYGRDKQLVGRESPDGTVKSAGPEVKRKLKNRMTGIERATDRLTKEEAEQIDEISDKTKASYLEKAKKEVKELQPHAKGEYGGIAKRLIARRKRGIALASK